MTTRKIINLLQFVKDIITELLANKMRTMLSSLGVVVAVTSIMLVIGIMKGVEHNLIKEFKDMGSETMIIDQNMFKMFSQENARTLTLNEWRALKAHIRFTTPVVAFTAVRLKNGNLIKHNDKETIGSILGTSPDFPTLTSRYPIRGRYLTSGDDRSHRRVCVVSEELVEKLNLNIQTLIGTQIRVGPTWLRVVGIMPGASNNLLRTSADIYIPMSLAKELVDSSIDLKLGFRVISPEHESAVKKRVTQVLRQSQGTPPSESNDFVIEDVSEIRQMTGNTIAKISSVLLLLASISLIVGGIGIMNVMLFSVKERTREIGLFRALGATQQNIKYMFLVESTLLTGVGAVFGIIFGWALSHLAVQMIPGVESAFIPWWSVALAVGISTLTGLIFGALPATRAAKLDPINAMKAI